MTKKKVGDTIDDKKKLGTNMRLPFILYLLICFDTIFKYRYKKKKVNL
jgi:hypothetical protein